jgi:site-specific DNA-methyltransferase (adenine-specific)
VDVDDVILGDSLELLQDIERFPDDTFDAVMTSPPYFQQRHYNDVGMGFEVTQQEYLDKLLRLFEQCIRVVKPTGSIVFNLGDKYVGGSLALLPYKFAIAASERFPVSLINTVTWIKSNPTPRQDQSKLINATEPFFVFTKTKNYHFNSDLYQTHLDKTPDKVGDNVGSMYFTMIDASTLSEDEKQAARIALTSAIQEAKNGLITGLRMKIRGIHALAYGGLEGGRNNQIETKGFTIIKLRGKTLKKDVLREDVIETNVETIKGNKHPAIFPQTIIEELIRLLTPENGIVFDPFNGSATTSIAAMNTNRHYCGIEIDPAYLAIGHDRIEKYEMDCNATTSKVKPVASITELEWITIGTN